MEGSESEGGRREREWTVWEKREEGVEEEVRFIFYYICRSMLFYSMFMVLYYVKLVIFEDIKFSYSGLL